MIETPIYRGILQSDLNLNGFSAGGGGGGGSTGLDANTVLAADIGLVGDGATDNTTALQTWITSVQTAKVNSTLLVPDGIYIFSGALQDASGANAQIIMPSNDVYTAQYSITIKGYHPICYSPWPYLSTVPVPKGPVFKSTLATGSGTQPSFIGIKGPASPTPSSPVSFVRVQFENMIFQTVSNPQITCLNLKQCTSVGLGGDTLIVAGNGIGFDSAVQPTTATSYGLILPPTATTMWSKIDNLNVVNFYTGVMNGELCHLESIGAALCMVAFECPCTYLGSLIVRLWDNWCPTGIKVTVGGGASGIAPFQVLHNAIERGGFAGTPAWTPRIYDVDDPSNYAAADITWWNTAGQGAFTINGGSGIRARQMGTSIGLDLRLVQISGGGKLQARNTSTGLWADVDQWTNP